MFSAMRVAATRAAPRVANLSSVVSMTRPQAAMSQLRYFGDRPTFLDQAEVAERIMTVVKNFDQVDPSKVTPETKFSEDLGLDSLDVVEVVMAIEDEFAIEIPDTEADAMTTVADAVDFISTHPMAK